MASWPITVWCSSTWFSTDPSAYLVSSVCRRHFDRFGDRDAEAAGAVRRVGEDRSPVVGVRRRAGNARRAERFHEQPTIGLLVVRHPHHEDLNVDAEQRARERQRRAPLAGAGLRGDLPGARFPVVKGLRHRRVRLVAAGWTHAFVLVVDPGWRLESLLEPPRTEERCRTPLPVDVAHGFGDLDLARARNLLHDERDREQRREIVRSDRLHRPRVQHRRRRRWQVGHQVVPGFRDP